VLPRETRGPKRRTGLGHERIQHRGSPEWRGRVEAFPLCVAGVLDHEQLPHKVDVSVACPRCGHAFDIASAVDARSEGIVHTIFFRWPELLYGQQVVTCSSDSLDRVGGAFSRDLWIRFNRAPMLER
jgi:hypothetical protein